MSHLIRHMTLYDLIGSPYLGGGSALISSGRGSGVSAPKTFRGVAGGDSLSVRFYNPSRRKLARPALSRLLRLTPSVLLHGIPGFHGANARNRRMPLPWVDYRHVSPSPSEEGCQALHYYI
jgi:hypothetical protein